MKKLTKASESLVAAKPSKPSKRLVNAPAAVSNKAAKAPTTKRVARKKTGARSASQTAITTRDAPQASANEDSNPALIVGIGASAGGLEALETFFKAMSSTSGIGFVLVVHLDPTHISILPELLQKYTAMPVRPIVDAMKVERDHVYVIPPNKDVNIVHGTLHLADLDHPRGAKLPIDSFFRSLAEDQQRHAVSIILSGTGADGTLGAKAIKNHFGVVIAQDETSAKYTGMPRSVANAGLVDFVLPPQDMPEQLARYTRFSRNSAASRTSSVVRSGSHALQQIFLTLRTRTGHDFSMYKINTISRRVHRRMAVQQIDDITDYAAYLQSTEPEAEILFKELLIGVTSFFRDPAAFEYLQTVALPDMLLQKNTDDSIRAWVAGCSSGEEAYSLAMALHSLMEHTNRHYNVQIFATDINDDAINSARSGLYPNSITASVSEEHLARYFLKEQGQYRVKKTIREMIVFAPQNVIKDPPFTKLDVLSCRNLLIYLNAKLQQNLLPIFHYALNPGGLLFLGSSESVGQNTDLFSPLNKKHRVFARNDSSMSHRRSVHFPAQPTPFQVHDHLHTEPVAAGQQAEELSTLQLVETVLKQSATPPCAIITEGGNVVYVHGRLGAFLEPAEGKASVSIIDMARNGLKSELIAAIRHATLYKKSVSSQVEVTTYDGKRQLVALTIKPVLEHTSARGLLMVSFEQIDSSSRRARAKRESATSSRPVKSANELEMELAQTKEALQTTIEELEAANEELKSANEELQSTNEEMQSTNEELETSKEELQSLNEEASTVNTELQGRIDELSKATDDMRNLLESAEIGTIFLDTELRVRRYTSKSTEVIPLTAADQGRPLADLATTLVATNPSAVGASVLEDLVVREVEVMSHRGASYIMRVRPYRTASNVIEGVVITFENVSERKKALDTLRNSEQKFRTLVESSPYCIHEIDAHGRFTSINQAGLEMLGESDEAAIVGRPYTSTITKSDQARISQLMKDAFAGAFVSFEFSGTDGLEFNSNFVPIYEVDGKVDRLLGITRNITAHKLVEQALGEAEQRYRALFELSADSIVLIDEDTMCFAEYNEHAHERLGYTRDEFSKLAISDVRVPPSTKRRARRAHSLVEHNSSSVVTSQFKTKSGQLVDVEVSETVINIEQRKFVLSVWRPITRA